MYKLLVIIFFISEKQNLNKHVQVAVSFYDLDILLLSVFNGNRKANIERLQNLQILSWHCQIEFFGTL